MFNNFVRISRYRREDAEPAALDVPVRVRRGKNAIAQNLRGGRGMRGEVERLAIPAKKNYYATIIVTI